MKLLRGRYLLSAGWISPEKLDRLNKIDYHIGRDARDWISHPILKRRYPMPLLGAIEISLFVIFVYLIINQLAIPLINGTALFPFLRKQHDLEKELTNVKQTLAEKELKREILQNFGKYDKVNSLWEYLELTEPKENREVGEAI